VSRVLWVYGDHMLRPRARMGRAPAVVRRHGMVLGPLLALLLPLAGCGSADEQKSDEPSKAALSCRDEWHDLEAALGGRNSMTNPSALSPRWNTIAATVDYYATSASADDCGATVEAQQTAMDDLTSFATKLAPYDMELRLDEVKSDAGAYAAGPRLPAPKPSPTKKGKKEKRPLAPPTPAVVAAALTTLTAQAPVATAQQGPGWQQALVADLGDTAAVAKTVKDLAFLSTESAAYRACTVALAQIRTALTAAAH
jgi:hypothetical protein